MTRALLLALLLLPLPAAGARQTPAPAPAGGGQLTREEQSLATLAALQKTLARKEQDLERLRAEYAAATTDERRLQKLAELRTLQDEIDRLETDFESIATGIDVAAFDLGTEDGFDFRQELEKLLAPIIQELKDATEAPRQIERLRTELERSVERERLADEALRSVEGLLERLPEGQFPELRSELEESRGEWQVRLSEIEDQRQVAGFQLEKRLSQRTSVIDSFRTTLAEFFRSRGLNLLLAVAAFCAVLFGMQRLRRLVARVLPGRKASKEGAFYARLVFVVYMLLVGVASVSAALIVLYASGDWVLLGLALLFLLGVAWASKTAVPMFLEQIRLLLNLGAVREHERVVVDGIPYRVSRLSLFSILSNPDLAGGVRRAPLRDLLEMRSRPCSKDEIWFPSRRGDWVLLSDGKRGHVLHQSPEMVQIELLGGSRVTYPTADYMALSPQNLSVGFRVNVRFGVDYAHQAIATDRVPEVLMRRVRAGLVELVGAEAVVQVRVEFLEAGASSLDYAVLADLAGSVAAKHDVAQRAIQRLCVETCNAEGWVIPFTQVTLHQAAATA